MTATLGPPGPKVALFFRQTNGVSMGRPLTGRVILIAEDEPLVALDCPSSDALRQFEVLAKGGSGSVAVSG